MKLPMPLKNFNLFYGNFDFYKPRISGYILIIAFAALFFVYGFHKISFLAPQSVHQWRQCDCLSFAQQYYENGNSFWTPQLHYLGEDDTGKTASDFPLIYYSVAQIWKLTGKHEFIYRWLILFISLSGILFFHKTTEQLINSSFWSLIISLLLFSSTIYVYYSNNFLMNVPAMALALVALYYFYRYYKSYKLAHLLIAFILYTLAGLLKIQALTSFLAISGLVIMQILPFFGMDKTKFIKHPKLFILLSLMLFIVIFSWYYYAHAYNEKHNKGIFLIGILPIWNYNIGQINHVLEYARILWLNSYQSKLLQSIAGASFIFVLLNRKKLHTHLLQFLILLSLGFLLYLILWFQVFDNHDYYLINQLLLMKVVLIAALLVLKDKKPQIYQSHLLKILAIILLIYNIQTCAHNIQTRYNGWPNEKHIKYYRALESIEKSGIMNHIGLNEKVLVIDDPSFNISLYLINRKGFTNAIGKLKDSAEIAEKINLGYKYLFINDTMMLNAKYIQPFIHTKVGKYQNIHVFSLENNLIN